MNSELCTVFLKRDGGVAYGGYYWSVTLRACIMPDGQIVRGTMTLAQDLMDEQLQAVASGMIALDPACRVRDQQDQRPSDEQPSPQKGSATPVGQQTEHTLTIQRGNNQKGKLAYWLTYKLDNGQDPRGPLEVSSPEAIKLLEQSLREAGFTPEKVPGQPFPFEMEVAFHPGKPFPNDPTKHYRDWDYFKVLSKKAAKA